jgi:hypothetical protein
LGENKQLKNGEDQDGCFETGVMKTQKSRCHFKQDDRRKENIGKAHHVSCSVIFSQLHIMSSSEKEDHG